MHKNAYKNLYFISNLNKGNNDFERKKESKILGLADHSRRVRGLLARQVLLGGGETGQWMARCLLGGEHVTNACDLLVR